MKKTIQIGSYLFGFIWVVAGGAAMWNIVSAPQSASTPTVAVEENQTSVQKLKEETKDRIKEITTEASKPEILPEPAEKALLSLLAQENGTAPEAQDGSGLSLYNATEGTPEVSALLPQDPAFAVNGTSFNGTKEFSGEHLPEQTIILPGQSALVQGETIVEEASKENPEPENVLAGNQQEASKSELSKPASGDTKRSNPPVIVYNEANRRGAGNAVRGSVQSAVATEDHAVLLFPTDWNTSRGTRALRMHEQDSTVSLAVIEELAEFLGRSYWPVGTHPMARREALTSANMQWIINRYGLELHGFRSINSGDSDAARRQLLDYLLTPSMVKALYRLYSDSFVRAMGNATIQQRRVIQGGPYRASSFDVAGMYSHYAMKSFALAGAMRGYLQSSDIKAKVAHYVASERTASEAHVSLFKQQLPEKEVDVIRVSAKQYQAAIWQREISKQNLAAAMRRGGNTRGLTSDELVYLSLWMTRRHSGQQEGLAATADMLEQLSVRLELESEKFRLATQRP